MKHIKKLLLDDGCNMQLLVKYFIDPNYGTVYLNEIENLATGAVYKTSGLVLPKKTMVCTDNGHTYGTYRYICEYVKTQLSAHIYDDEGKCYAHEVGL